MERLLLLLGLLRQEDMHGYQLNEFIERDLAFCTDIKKPTAYYLLDKLAKDGYIAEVEDGGGPKGRPPRKTYRITPEGEAYFETLLRENLSSYERQIFPGDIGLAFVDALPRDEARALLAERLSHMQAELEAVRQTPPHRGALRFVIEHQIRHLQAELGWLHGVLDWLASHND
jgi:DNA-binding PadR family transcriptional regulator